MHLEPPRSFNKRAFFEDLGYAPHPGQVEIHASPASRRVVACGVRWGKTLCAAMEGLAAAMEPKERSMGWVVAPTYDLAEKVFREVIYIVGTHLSHRIVVMKENEKRLVLRNMAGGFSEIRGKSADNPVSLLGEGLDWVIIDEAARLKPSIWEGHLTQRLIDKKGWALLISTPRGKGCFYDLFRRGQNGNDAEYASWNSPSRANPYLEEEAIEAERARLPERVFRQEFEGEFLEGAGQVFRNVRDCATGTFKEPVKDEWYYGGLDLAKVEDYTVLVIVNQKCEVVFVDRFHRLDWELQIVRIKAALARYEGSLLIDSTGIGEPIFERFCEADIPAEAYLLTARSKSALINNVSLMLEQRLVTLPRPDLWPEGIDELEAFEFSVTDQGNVRTGAPSGYHDDCVIALGLALWRRRPGGYQIPEVYP